jgi:hypothetical protein
MVGAYLGREAIKPALIPTKKANRDKYLRAGATLLQSESCLYGFWIFFSLNSTLLTD